MNKDELLQTLEKLKITMDRIGSLFENNNKEIAEFEYARWRQEIFLTRMKNVLSKRLSLIINKSWIYCATYSIIFSTAP